MGWSVVTTIRMRTLEAIAACALLCGGTTAFAQDIEPRAYSNAPVGVNFLITGYAFTDGGLPLDPAVPLTDLQLETSNMVLGYFRVLDLWGKSAKVDAVVPFTWLSGSAEFAGETVDRDVQGFGDPRFRLSVNFFGAPAMRLPQFGQYRQDVIVGASLQVSVPWGQYDDERLVNIGTHRWSFKPEVGVSKALGRWTLEATAGATLFTDNTDFFGGITRSQDPLYSLQAHVIYSFLSGMWTSVDATWFTGGQTSLDGTRLDNRQRNWRLGATLAIPVNRHHSVKLYASRGVSARTGNNFDVLGAAWQFRWGGGL
ncbi:MAG: transporter [Candidatus Polarisedimenticolia bacterium]